MNLPPLPEPAVQPSSLITRDGVWGKLYTEAQMIAYAKYALRAQHGPETNFGTIAPDNSAIIRRLREQAADVWSDWKDDDLMIEAANALEGKNVSN